MSGEQLSGILGVAIVPSILEDLGIDAALHVGEVTEFYNSQLYALLSNPETGMWHLSPVMLADLYREERETGGFEVPEEQS